MHNLKSRVWWEYLDHDIKELLLQSQILIDVSKNWEKSYSEPIGIFHDYSFIVFPAAKAYEGFLKKLFLDQGFISKSDFSGKRFRIGKALNPALYKKEMRVHSRFKRLRRKLSVYDKIVAYCGGEELAGAMWDTWRECRNLLFHWFPKEKNAIDYIEAKEKVQKIIDTIDMAFVACKIN